MTSFLTLYVSCRQVLFTGPTQLLAAINFCTSPNSLEEKYNELLEVPDLVTYTQCQGCAGILISFAFLWPFAWLPAMNSPSEVRVRGAVLHHSSFLLSANETRRGINF